MGRRLAMPRSTPNIWLCPPPTHHLLRPVPIRTQNSFKNLYLIEHLGIVVSRVQQLKRCNILLPSPSTTRSSPHIPRRSRSSDDGESGESRKMTFHTVLCLDGMEHVHHSAGDYFSFLLVDDDTGLEILHVHAMTVLESQSLDEYHQVERFRVGGYG
ncbi:hypothetical protein EV421DRAFT_1805161 [Armillaria borealis]|uniref:Uncharacterized protein n=1 Tax=Armillaria borealis TaxID=47425 RepID=A0AA39MQS0_9AGAR|nr:hypothetical protein EV421DRAFT_1805161 [Armillaria borealis]